MESSKEIIIFYKYTAIADPKGFLKWLQLNGTELNLLGRILIAREGINGTVEGSVDRIAEFERRMKAQDGSAGTFGDFTDVVFKSSPGTGDAFEKLKVKVRSEIVTTGLSADKDINPNEITGTHLEPEELKTWIESGEEFEIVDMRNDYEFAVGHFKGSHESGMKNFRDLAKTAKDLDIPKEKKVLTVCTYGVRCEKASGYLRQLGYKDVFQLNGGIGTYMKKYPGQDFLGSLYVFDHRITERFTDDYERIGTCVSCRTTSERFGNCARDDCHKQLIICEACAPNVSSIYCSTVCRILDTPRRLFVQLRAKTEEVPP